MNEYVAKITLDLNCQATPVVISAGQFDIGRKIQITLTADGEAYDATGATAVCKGKNNNNYFAVNAAVSKNIVTVTTDKAMLSSAGRTIAKIVLTDGTHTYSTQPFVINTHSDYDGDITTSDYYPELLNILSHVLALTESGAILTDTELSATSVNPLQNKALTPIISRINSRLQSAELNLRNKADATTTDTALAQKEVLANKVSSKTDITDRRVNYPSIEYLGEYYYDASETYSSAETNELLGNKANLVNSLNIFDFDAWAKGLQSLTNPVYRGTLDKVDYTEKSFALTATEPRAYTNGWISSTYPQSMRIAVKPNTKYLFSWLPSSTKCGAYVFLNGVNSDTTRFELRKGFGSFTTAEDTAYIMIRFDYDGTGFFKVSEIMITEKESIYLPNKVAEGVPEVADEILAFEKTTQTSLDGKYDSSNIESGTSTLTPYSTVTDKIKSASCMYKTIGDIVIVSATVKMNAATIGANSTYPLIDLPYKCIAEDNVFCVGISNLGKVFKFAVLKNNTWLQFQTQDKTTYTFADGEQINAICLYKIK